jgi:hypothetical protein
MPSFPSGRQRSANNERHERNCRPEMSFEHDSSSPCPMASATCKSTRHCALPRRQSPAGISASSNTPSRDWKRSRKAAGRVLRLRPYKPRCAARCSRSLGTEARIGRYPNCQQQSYRWGNSLEGSTRAQAVGRIHQESWLGRILLTLGTGVQRTMSVAHRPHAFNSPPGRLLLAGGHEAANHAL